MSPSESQGLLTSASDVNPASLSASDPHLLRIFYQRLFPWRYFFQWLNHSPQPTKDFEHRELAFTLPNDAMLRYMSYRTSDLWVARG